MTVVRRSLEHLAPVNTTPRPGELSLDAEPWMADALCAQTDPELFFPEKGGSAAAAKAICRRCPVLADCRAYALADVENGYWFGIWGGLSAVERRKLLKERS